MSGSIQAAIWQMVPLTKALGIQVEKAKPGRARVSLPRAEPALNHLGQYHAASLYALAESATAALFAASFDLSRVDLVTRSGSIHYDKLATGTVHCVARFDNGELERLLADLDETGRVKYEQKVEIVDEGDEVTSTARFDLLVRTAE